VSGPNDPCSNAIRECMPPDQFGSSSYKLFMFEMPPPKTITSFASAARLASHSRSATSRSGVPGFVASRAICAAMTRSNASAR
jgi:hypothetical protein